VAVPPSNVPLKLSFPLYTFTSQLSSMFIYPIPLHKKEVKRRSVALRSGILLRLTRKRRCFVAIPYIAFDWRRRTESGVLLRSLINTH